MAYFIILFYCVQFIAEFSKLQRQTQKHKNPAGDWNTGKPEYLQLMETIAQFKIIFERKK